MQWNCYQYRFYINLIDIQVKIYDHGQPGSQKSAGGGSFGLGFPLTVQPVEVHLMWPLEQKQLLQPSLNDLPATHFRSVVSILSENYHFYRNGILLNLYILIEAKKAVYIPANTVATHRATNNRAIHLFIILVLFQTKILFEQLSKNNWINHASDWSCIFSAIDECDYALNVRSKEINPVFLIMCSK